jgi:FKBP-type peptidyl-prolyl cis-trans isomerase FkpA
LVGGDQWESRGIIVDADSIETELLFLQGCSTDGSGPLIDNIRVFEISQPGELTVDANVNTDGTGDSTLYNRGIGAVPIANNFGITGDDLSSVTVTLNGVVDGTNEVLGVSAANITNDNISVASFDHATRQLKLTGQATAAEYQTALQSLSYFNGAHGTATTTLRQAVVSVTDVNNQTESVAIQIPFETDQDSIDDALIQKFIVNNGLAGEAQAVQEGLFAVIDNPGSGQNPTINSIVRVAYSGYLLELNDQNQLVEGLNFDASDAEGISFSLAQVIRGWTLGIPQFKTGGSGKLLIPSRLGYGSFGAGSDIPPNAVLVFDVNLLEIVS